jgi:serine/threonine-protein kinase
VNESRSEDLGSKHDLIGRRLLDRYVIEARIARGGMAMVFRGLDERLHRPVCVKVFFGFDPHQPEYAVVLEHFVQEAFALSSLRHPNTLRIYDFGYLDDEARTGPFFVTEMADGGHLGDLLGELGPLQPREMLRILQPIVGALSEAHEADIVHRDLKPSNILFTGSGAKRLPKLADFSIAKASGDLPNRASDTNAQVPLYSLSWAAPEQLSEQPVDVTADVFALGLVVAFMLTDQLVYPGSDLMALWGLRAEGAEYREAAIRCLGLPPAIERAILQACAEQAGDRPRSVQALYEALETAVEATGHPRKRPRADEDDDMPTDRHARLADVVHVPQSAPPLAEVPVARPAEAPAAPWEAAPPAAAPTDKPRLPLSRLDVPQVVIGNRRMTVAELGTDVLVLPQALAGRPARMRVTAMDVGHGRAHLKGLNCFIQRADGRPSSGIDVDARCVVYLLDPQTGARGEVWVAVGRNRDGDHELELHDVVIVVPSALARWAAVIETSGGRDTTLIFVRPSP